MGKTFETREKTYDFYDWMKERKVKTYLDKIDFEIICLSLRSSGLNPKSVCLYGRKGFPNCHCNTCLHKIKEHNGFKVGKIFYFNEHKVKIKHFCPLEHCKDVFIKGVDNGYFYKWVTSEEVKEQLKRDINKVNIQLNK